jgi:thiamine-phosphate pyrophosphorylase
VLCFVASRSTVKDGDVENAIKEAVAGGVTMVLLAEKEMPAGELLALARRVKAITRGKALLIIDDRVDVAEALEADGIHLPEDGLPTKVARGLIGKYAVVGRTVRDAESGTQASRDGAEFVMAGTIYKSQSRPDTKPTGPGLIAEITKDSSLPVLAIGGVVAAKVEELVQAGAAGVAVVSAIAKADDMKAAAEELTTAMKEAWANRAAAAAAKA